MHRSAACFAQLDLESEWDRLPSERRRKWLTIANRFPALPPSSNCAFRERVRAWIKLDTQERQRARAAFQAAIQLDAEERRSKMGGLPGLAGREAVRAGRQSRKETGAGRHHPGPQPEGALAAVPKSNVVPGPARVTAALAVAPTLFQAKPGASTVLMTRPSRPQPPVGRSVQGDCRPCPGGPQDPAAEVAASCWVGFLEMTAPAVDALPPAMLRRLCRLLYEGVLLFGVVFFAGYLFSVSTSQHHALQGRHTLGAFLFVVIGIYFVWFWSRSGKRWRSRPGICAWSRWTGSPSAVACAAALPAGLVVVPARTGQRLGDGDPPGGALSAIVLGGMVAYAMLAKLHPSSSCCTRP